MDDAQMNNMHTTATTLALNVVLILLLVALIALGAYYLGRKGAPVAISYNMSDAAQKVTQGYTNDSQIMPTGGTCTNQKLSCETAGGTWVPECSRVGSENKCLEFSASYGMCTYSQKVDGPSCSGSGTSNMMPVCEIAGPPQCMSNSIITAYRYSYVCRDACGNRYYVK